MLVARVVHLRARDRGRRAEEVAEARRARVDVEGERGLDAAERGALEMAVERAPHERHRGRDAGRVRDARDEPVEVIAIRDGHAARDCDDTGAELVVYVTSIRPSSVPLHTVRPPRRSRCASLAA